MGSKGADEEEYPTNVIQVTNIAPSATKEQIKSLFEFLGRVDRIELYPENEFVPVPVKVAFIQFHEPENCGVAMHLTNTVFIDRALIIIPLLDGKIPDEGTAISQLVPGGRLMPGAAIPGLSCAVVMGDELQRTVYVGNLDPTTTPESLMTFFSQAGEIKYVRMGGEEAAGSICAFVEYTEMTTIPTSLTYHMNVFNGRHIKVMPSNTAIIKPQTATTSIAGLNSKELDEALKKVREASSLIAGTVDNEMRKHSRSRSRSRKRSRSRSRRRSHSRRSHRRSRSRSRRSRSRRRSGSRTRRSKSRRSKSTDRKIRKRSRSTSKNRRRSRSKERIKSRSKDRKRSPSTSKDRKRSRSKDKKRSPSRDKSSKRSKSKERKKSVEKIKEEVKTEEKEEESGKETPVPEKSSKSKKKDDSERRSSRRSESKTPKHERDATVSSKRDDTRVRRKSRSPSPPPRRRRSGSRGRSSRAEKTARTRVRSRSDSRSGRPKKDRKRSRSPEKDKHRSRSQDRKKKHTKETKVVRDYDEEEKGFNATSDNDSDAVVQENPVSDVKEEVDSGREEQSSGEESPGEKARRTDRLNMPPPADLPECKSDNDMDTSD